MAFPLRAKVLYGACTALAALVLAEAAARLAAPPRAASPKTPVSFVGNDPEGRFPTEWDDDLFWRVPSNASIPDLTPPERVNSMGFRGPEFARQKPPGTRRLLLLGDSCTFGMGADGDANYAHRLRRWLRSPGGEPWEVVNLAIPGYSSYQMLQMLRTRGAELAPDVVSVYAGAWNDYTPAIGRDDETAHRLVRKAREAGSGFGFARLQLYRSLAERFAPPVVESTAQRKIYQELWSSKAERPDGPRVPPEKFRAFLTAIARESRALGAKVVFIVPPAPALTRARFKDGEIYAGIVAEVGAKEADRCIDARARLSTPRQFGAEFFCDLIHPSAVGHGVLAEALAAALVDLGAAGLPPVPPSALVAPPRSLLGLARTVVIEAGEPPVPAELTEDARRALGNVLSFSAPHRIRLLDVEVPAESSMLLTLTFVTRKSRAKEDLEGLPPAIVEVGPIEFELAAEAPGLPSRVLFQEKLFSRNKMAWSPPIERRVDLAEFAGKRATLTFACRGFAPLAAWGTLPITQFR